MTRCNCVVLFCVLACGCSDRPTLAPVKGTVTLDGKPLASGTVMFETKGARQATGKIVKGEIVEVTTYAPNDGLTVGQHNVAVVSIEEAAKPGDGKVTKGDYMSGKSLIPAKYNDPNASGLKVDIKNGENAVELKLTSNPQ